MTRPSTRKGWTTSDEPHMYTHGLLKVYTHFETPIADYRTVHRECAVQERDPPPMSYPFVNHSNKKIRKGIRTSTESPRIKQDTRKQHRGRSSTNISRAIREKKQQSSSSDCQKPQTSQEENCYSPDQQPYHYASQFVASTNDFSMTSHDAADVLIVEPRNTVVELQRQEQRLAEAISNRLERKRNISVKTKKAVLEAMLCRDPDEEVDLCQPNPSAGNPKRRPTLVGTVKSKNQVAPDIPTFQAIDNNVVQSSKKFGEKSNQKTDQTPDWLQKARTTFGRPYAREIDMPKSGNFRRTSQPQQKLWLKEVVKAISEARATEVSYMPRAALRSHSEFQALRDFGLSSKLSQQEKLSSPSRAVFVTKGEEKVYPQSVPAPPVASFMSSDGDDDDDSVSSVVLLFNYLSCNAVPDRKLQINHRGNLVLVESLESEYNSLAEDYSIKKRRIPKYQLVCSP